MSLKKKSDDNAAVDLRRNDLGKFVSDNDNADNDDSYDTVMMI